MLPIAIAPFLRALLMERREIRPRQRLDARRLRQPGEKSRDRSARDVAACRRAIGTDGRMSMCPASFSSTAPARSVNDRSGSLQHTTRKDISASLRRRRHKPPNCSLGSASRATARGASFSSSTGRYSCGRRPPFASPAGSPFHGASPPPSCGFPFRSAMRHTAWSPPFAVAFPVPPMRVRSRHPRSAVV